jgi:aminoglycoside 6-adenylyltransferase
MPDYADLERCIVAWARAEPIIRSALVVGSRARIERPADEWSDLDLILFVTDRERHAAGADWLSAISTPLIPVFERYPSGNVEWLVLFASGLKADFYFALATAPLRTLVAGSPLDFVLQRGYRVVLDRDDPSFEGHHEPGSPAPVPLPAPADFAATLNELWLYAWSVARSLRRGALWIAKAEGDGYLKERMLTLLEWHALAMHGPEYDTWHNGRFLENWGDPRALARLPATFGSYDVADLWRALFETLDLCDWLARESAARLGFTYPAETRARMIALIRAMASD